MEEKINIAEILKDKKNGLRLYSPIFGECTFCYVREDTNDICVKKHNGVKEFFDSKGLYYNTGEVMLFPSKEMRDWRKLDWKKGYVLVNEDGDAHVIFEGFDDDTYETFNGNYYLENNVGIVSFVEHEGNFLTSEFDKSNKENAQEYISTIEECLCGKLNRETLEIDKTQPEFKDGDILSCDEDTYTKHTTLILHKNGCVVESLVSLIRHNDLVESREPINEVLLSRLYPAREDEKKELFDALAKGGKAWDAKKKQIVDLKPKVELKPFDRVLVRDFEDQAWQVSLFSYKDSDSYYCCNGCSWNQCIPYIGNESLLGTTKDVEG